MTWEQAVQAASLGIIAASGWVMVCSKFTYRDRIRLLAAFKGRSDFWSLVESFDKVSYDAHMWARVRLCNPWKLYPQNIRDLAALMGAIKS